MCTYTFTTRLFFGVRLLKFTQSSNVLQMDNFQCWFDETCFHFSNISILHFKIRSICFISKRITDLFHPREIFWLFPINMNFIFVAHLVFNNLMLNRRTKLIFHSEEMLWNNFYICKRHLHARNIVTLTVFTIRSAKFIYLAVIKTIII